MRALRNLLLLALMAWGASGCDLLGVVGETNTAPEADAGEDQSVYVGETVTLDGFGSTDAEGTSLTYSWTIVEQPDTSDAVLSGADTDSPTLVPDVPGTYRFELEVSDGDDTGTDEVVVTAAWDLRLSGTMSSDTTLVDRGAPYVVTGTWSIAGAVVIAPGVTVEVEAGHGIWVGTGGSLTAVGTASDSIRFVGTTATAGHWDGIHFRSVDADNQLSYVVVEHGGGTYESNVQVWWDGQAAISHTSMRNGSGFGLVVASEGDIPSFASNAFSSLTSGAVLITAENLGKLDAASTYGAGGLVEVEGGTTVGTQTWKAIDTSYRMSGTVNVSTPVTVEPGAVFEFEQGHGLWVGSTGSFSAVGTATDTIRFVGVDAVAGHWDGLHFRTLATANELTYVEVSDGGSTYEANVTVWWNGQVEVTESRLHNSSGYGMIAQGDGRIVAFSSNVLTGNTLGAMEILPEHMAKIDAASSYSGNTADYVIVLGGAVGTAGTGTWPAIDVPYRFTGTVTVDRPVVVSPGTEIVVEQGHGIWVGDNGSFQAVGTATDSIRFSGVQATSNFWDGLHFRTQSPDNVLDYVNIGHGGNTYDADVYVWWNGAATVTNSTIHHATIGLYVHQTGGGSLTHSNNTYHDVGTNVVVD